KGLKIKVSGCFNSCGQHHVSDLGFFGVGRIHDKRAVPHFQVVLGGQWDQNGGSYGLGIGAVPSKNIPETVDRLTAAYLKDHQNGEKFKDFVARIGKGEVKKLINDLTRIPGHAEDPSFYSDWGDPREYTKEDIGVGECAGEVVSALTFELTAAERQVFDAQLLLDKGDAVEAAELAFEAMITAAKGMLRVRVPNVPADTDKAVDLFRSEYFDTGLFLDPFAGPKFANYLFAAAGDRNRTHTKDTAHTFIEEAGLFIEACHSCHARMSEQQAPAL
ncbi:MAG: nitrite/sulfite reductase, partial [Pseudanabaenales cyanobacterium]|nr:nitrite/sulfite reductase [Pseudanabaenales cyanobacterium]